MPQASTGTRRIDQLLAEYGESHQNETNKLVHWFAVPVIVWTVVALFYELPFPAALKFAPWVNWASVLLILSLLYYVALSPPLAVGFLAFALACFAVCVYWPTQIVPLWQGALAIFVIAWIFQFWGHKVEGKKPSFFKDVQFLMIGPAWLLHFLYRKLGIRY